MTIKEERLQLLFNKLFEAPLNPREEAEWLQLSSDPGLDPLREQLIGQAYDNIPLHYKMEPALAEALFHRILDTRAVNRSHVRSLYFSRVAVAAAVLLVLIGISLLVWHRKASAPVAVIVPASAPDIPPGGNKAILTLANGQHIVLDSAHTGLIAEQGAAHIVKTGDGRLAYEEVQKGDRAVTYNTLTTPRGGLYQLLLPDGTKVWLNAASSITYPTAFTGNSRKVSITGEAYFEVAKNSNAPFIVKADLGQVTVLGTQFNIMAYPDEEGIRATLLQGGIRLDNSSNDHTKTGGLLRPGEEGKLDRVTGNIKIRQADTAAAIAWVHGELSMEGLDLGALTRQLSRWYDIDIRLKGDIPTRTFGGTLLRNVNLSYMLEALKANGIHTVLEGRTVTISAN